MVSSMEAILATITGLVGVLLSALLVWIHSDIRSLRSETNSQFQAQRTETNARFDAVDRRFDGVDRRFDTVDRRFDTVDRKLDSQNATSSRHGERIARVEGIVAAPEPLSEEAATERTVAG